MSTLIAYLLFQWLAQLPKAETPSRDIPAPLRPSYSQRRIARSAVAWGHKEVSRG